MNTLYIITGAPGSGKTTYGKRLAAELKAAFLDIDTATETLVRASLQTMGKDPDDRDSPFFKSAFRNPIYENLFAIAQDNLAHTNVVLTGPFTSEKSNPNWNDELRAKMGGPVEIHYLSCSQETLKKRITQRGNPRDASKLENWDEYLQYHDDSLPIYAHTLVSS